MEKTEEIVQLIIEITQSEQQRKSRLKKMNSTSDLWDHNKRSNNCVIRVLEEEKKGGSEKLFKTSQIWQEVIYFQSQEV